MDGKNHLYVLIEVLGEWTESLKGRVICISEKEPPLKKQYSGITATVEGPYGHESTYHLSYENLILVGGSIGILVFIHSSAKLAHLVEYTNHVGHFQKVLTSIGNFCICSIVGMLVEIIVMYPIQQRKYKDGIDILLVLLIGGIPIAMPTVLSLGYLNHLLVQTCQPNNITLLGVLFCCFVLLVCLEL